MAKILYLFPDTNIFLQCKPLSQVTWSALGDWDQIEILITRPVQKEIDSLKGKGNNRQAARARATSSLIRELLDAQDGRKTLPEAPLVQLCLRHDLRREESVAEVLNYEERDDQLVGTALGFKKANPGAEVWLLTNDTGPMASAKTVALNYFKTPDEWLLPPEADDIEKREAALRAEVAHHKSLEPSFTISRVSPKEDRLHASVAIYLELSALDIERLVSRLITRFPKYNDFGPTESQERTIEQFPAWRLLGIDKEAFHPATQEEIDQYRSAYDQWQHECSEQLSKLSKTLNSALVWPQFSVELENIGSRPAENTLVQTSSQGAVLLRPPKREEDEEESITPKTPQLPSAPKPPKGRWEQVSRFGFVNTLSNLSGLQQFLSQENFGPHLSQSFSSDGRRLSRSLERDPNALYFKEGQRGQSSGLVSYTCEQWRHAQPAERFTFDVLCPLKPGEHSGLIRVEVHAANLTRPEVHQIPVRVIVEASSCLEIAEQMVSAHGA